MKRVGPASKLTTAMVLGAFGVVGCSRSVGPELSFWLGMAWICCTFAGAALVARLNKSVAYRVQAWIALALGASAYCLWIYVLTAGRTKLFREWNLGLAEITLVGALGVFATCAAAHLETGPLNQS